MTDWLKSYGAWVVRGFILAAIIVLVWALNSAHRAKASLSQELERQRLEKAGLVTEREARAKDLAAAEKKIVDNDAAFAAEKKRLEEVLGKKPKIIEVVRWETKEVPVYIGPAGVEDPPRTGVDPKDIVLTTKDTGHARAAQVTYETENNNHIFVGTIECLRDTPSPRLLFSSVVRAPVPVALREQESLPYRWGVGGILVATPDRLGVGPSVLFPTLETWGLQWDASAGVALSTKGFVGATGQLGARWR